MKIQLLQRKPLHIHFSVEGYFDRVLRAYHELGVDAELSVVPWFSRGVIPRLKITHYAAMNQGDITHITGDIHFAALATRPESTIVTVHDCGKLHSLKGVKREILRQIWFEQPLRRLGAITTNSAATRRDLLKWVPSLDPNRVHVIPVSVSPLFQPHNKVFNQEKPRILQIGVTENKNIARLIDAIDGLQCKLVIIGRLPDHIRQKLVERQIDYENLFNLTDDELVVQYEKADILAFASLFEGFGMPIIEAQLVGRPVITSNCTSMPEVAGEGALFVDPLNVSAIRDAISRVIEDPKLREDLVTKGSKNARRFDNLTIAKQYVALYESLYSRG